MKMMKTLSSTAALLALTVGIASAQGINLSWTDCGTNGVDNLAFGCASTSGQRQLISSFHAPAGMTAVNGLELQIRMQTSGAALGTWWDATCRPASSITFSNDFSLAPGSGLCNQYFEASAVATSFYVPNDGGPNRALFTHAHSLIEGFGPLPGLGPSEVYASRIQINNASTTTCSGGCLDGACLHLDRVAVTQVPGTPGGDFELTTPGTRNWVTWQGGGGLNCPDATPTKKATWGTIKSLYR